MRLDTLELRNFRKYSHATFTFPRPQAASDVGSFHILIGNNGAGKTTVLDAAAVALGVWLEKVPDSILANSHRRLKRDDKRLTSLALGDRTQFQQVPETMSVTAQGRLLDRDAITWGQSLQAGKARVSNQDSKEALGLIASVYQRVGNGESVVLPVISYYGAGRAWLAHNERHNAKAKTEGINNRWEAFYDCLNERIRVADLAHWFLGEHIEMGNRKGVPRPGFEVVRHAVLRCLPGADRIWYDSDFREIAISIDGNPQPFSNLSAGQQVMLSLVADLAIKMVTQNNFLVSDSLVPNSIGPSALTMLRDEQLPRVLAETPGVVLIDELDVHLHPTWQRHVRKDLRAVFPNVQFIGTTHSPQIIGGAQPEEIIRLLQGESHDVPAQSYGMDTNWILEVLMHADKIEPEIKQEIAGIANLIAARDLKAAQHKVSDIRQRIGNSDALQNVASTIERIKLLNK